MPRAALWLALLLAAACRAPSQPRRYVFIDGGAHRGESLEAFRRTGLFRRFPWRLYAIEANPALAARLARMPGVSVLNQAVWTEDGTVSFLVAEDTGLSRITDFAGVKGATVAVLSMDFGSWLRRSFSKDDFVIVSLDIEHAEGPVLRRLLADGAAAYLDRLYVEFHDGREGELTRGLRQAGVFLRPHSADEAIAQGLWLDDL